MPSYTEWLQGMISTPWALLAVASLFISSWFIGRLLLHHLLCLRLRHQPLAHLAAIGAGLDVWALLAFCSGYAKLLGDASAKTSLLALAFASLLYLGFSLKDGGYAKLWTCLKSNKWMFGILATLFLLALGNALCPPCGKTVDEQSYQIPLPFRWNADSFPYVYKDLPYSGYPAASSFIYWLLVAAGKITAPRVFCLSLCMLNTACLYFLFRSRVRTFGAIVLALALILPNTPAVMMTEAFVESFLLFNFICGVILLERGASSWRLGLAIGLFAGICAGIKLTGCGPAAVLGVGLLFKRGGLAMIPGFVLGGLAALPFYLRPFLQTGNPLYPYYAWLFSDNPATIEMSRHLHAIGGFVIYGREGLLNALLSPFGLVLFPEAYDGFWGYYVPVLFALCLYATFLAFKDGRRRTLYCGVGFLLLYIFWLLSSQQARFLGQAFVLMLLAAAALLAKFKRKIRLVILCLMIPASIFPTWFDFCGYYVSCWIPLLRQMPPDVFLSVVWKDGLCNAFGALHRDAPPEAKVMLVFEKRILNCPRHVIEATPFYQELFFTPPPTGSDSEIDNAVMKTIKDCGASYVLLCTVRGRTFMLPEIQSRNEALMQSFERLAFSGRLKIVESNRSHTLLKLVSQRQPGP